MLYFVTSTVKVICRISLPALLFVTVNGSTAFGSCIATSVPPGSVTVYVSAAQAGIAAIARKNASMNTDVAEMMAANKPLGKPLGINRFFSKPAS